MLDELDSHVDSTSHRLTKAQRRMQNFIKENQSAFAVSSRFRSLPLTPSSPHQARPRPGSSSFSSSFWPSFSSSFSSYDVSRLPRVPSSTSNGAHLSLLTQIFKHCITLPPWFLYPHSVIYTLDLAHVTLFGKHPVAAHSIPSSRLWPSWIPTLVPFTRCDWLLPFASQLNFLPQLRPIAHCAPLAR